jgi:putative redox protein
MAALKATIEMESPRRFLAHGYTGATVPIHFPREGEARTGPGPMELMLLGVGGCTAIDIVDILEKERETVEAFRIEMESERAPEPPTVFTRIHMKYVLRGDLKEANVKRAIDLSMEKYCGASIMLKRGGVDVTTSYVIEKPASGP